MSDGKHTPGPWSTLTAKDDKDYLRIRGTVLGCRYKIANVAQVRTIPELQEHYDAETLANARLIAAAPELLIAVKELLERAEGVLESEGHYFCEELLDGYRSLIAKATGTHHAP